MEMRRWVVALAIVLVALNVLDILITKAGLSVGCEESNGFAVALFTTFGFAVGILIKLGVVTVGGGFAVYSYRFDCRALRIISTTCLVYAVCLYIAVVCSNIITMLR